MISQSAYQRAAAKLGLSVAHIRAISEVESQGEGFFDDGQVKILFERHIFYRQLVKNKSQAYADLVHRSTPDICNPQRGGYGKFSEQHPKLQRAVKIDRNSALESCSWGAPQVLGANWADMGYSSVQELVNDAFTDDGQLELLVRFLQANPAIIRAAAQQNWPEVARRYNGPDYLANQYDTKLASAFDKWRNMA